MKRSFVPQFMVGYLSLGEWGVFLYICTLPLVLLRPLVSLGRWIDRRLKPNG